SSASVSGVSVRMAVLQLLKSGDESQEATSIVPCGCTVKSKSLSELFMPHPPLDKRIEALRTSEYLK
ncbi:protease HtpX, partial [Escherichia coli]|nr:protease HtpX [Escherichia coli]